MTPLRLGILGAARIAPFSVLAPAREIGGVEVVAVAARDGEQARRFAAQFGLNRAFEGYEALLHPALVDAVYIALPASEHARWAIAAAERGLHVLVEKPFTSNADEATRVVAAGTASERLVIEAFHWRYHPLAEAVLALTPRLGRILRAAATFEVARPCPDDIRWQLTLGGGALMDIGCYAVHWLRTLLNDEPEVVSAQAEIPVPEVDGAVDAILRFSAGVEAHVAVSMLGTRPPEEFVARVEVEGERGSLVIDNPLTPHARHQVSLRLDGRTLQFGLTAPSTYTCQLAAFRDGVLHGARLPTGGEDAVLNMRVIDALYRAAGLPPRCGS